MSARLELGALQALAAIVETGGITRAAQSLALSQSAISHKIRRLETALGCELLTRRSWAGLLTPEGDKLLGYARRILALHDEALSCLGTEPLRGKIRLGVTEDTTSGGVARILGRFARRHPDVSVRTHVGQSLTLEGQLDRGEIDVGFMQVFEHRQRVSDTVVAKEPLHWVKSRDFDLDMSRSIPFVAFDDDCFYRQWAMEAGQSLSPGLNTVMTCASVAGVKSAVLSGLGVTLLNRRHVTPEMEVMQAPFPEPPPIVYLLRTGRQRHSSAVRGLVGAITEEVETPAVPG